MVYLRDSAARIWGQAASMTTVLNRQEHLDATAYGLDMLANALI
jgi:hypothetical protein